MVNVLIAMFVVLVMVVVVLVAVLRFHMGLMLFFELIAEIDVVVDPVVIDRSRAKDIVIIKIKRKIDVIGAFRIQADITHLIPATGQVLAVHKELNGRRRFADTREA